MLFYNWICAWRSFFCLIRFCFSLSSSSILILNPVSSCKFSLIESYILIFRSSISCSLSLIESLLILYIIWRFSWAFIWEDLRFCYSWFCSWRMKTWFCRSDEFNCSLFLSFWTSFSWCCRFRIMFSFSMIPSFIFWILSFSFLFSSFKFVWSSCWIMFYFSFSDLSSCWFRFWIWDLNFSISLFWSAMKWILLKMSFYSYC